MCSTKGTHKIGVANPSIPALLKDNLGARESFEEPAPVHIGDAGPRRIDYLKLGKQMSHCYLDLGDGEPLSDAHPRSA